MAGYVDRRRSGRRNLYRELMEFTETQYEFLFSRLRRTECSSIPLRMRSASNPGGVGHDWVKHRFIVETDGRNRVSDFLDEADAFPNGSHDDQVDAVSGAFRGFTQQGRGIGLYF